MNVFRLWRFVAGLHSLLAGLFACLYRKGVSIQSRSSQGGLLHQVMYRTKRTSASTTSGGRGEYNYKEGESTKAAHAMHPKKAKMRHKLCFNKTSL